MDAAANQVAGFSVGKNMRAAIGFLLGVLTGLPLLLFVLPASRPADPAPPPRPTVAAEAETGELVLRVEDRETGRPARRAGAVRLWRIGEPADSLAAEAHLSTEGEVRFQELPAGRYRAQCAFQRAGAEDPPAFDVAGAVATRRLVVDLPREFAVGLRLFDEDGRPVEVGALKAVRHSSGTVRELVPAWARAEPPGLPDVFGIGGGAGGCGSPYGPPLVHATNGRIDLGTITESRRETSFSGHTTFDREGCNEVRVEFGGDRVGDRTLVAPCVRLERLLENVFLPDGCPAPPERASVYAWAETAVAEAPERDWRRVPVHVSVFLPGHKPLLYDWTAAGPHPRRTLLER